MNIRFPFNLCVVFAATVLFGSCSDSKPTEQMGLNKLNNSIPEKFKPLIEFKNFKKTNGVDGEIAGQKIYQMDYSVDKVAKQDLRTFKDFGQEKIVADTTALRDSIKWSEYTKKYGGQPLHYDRRIKKGEVIETIKKSLTFVKKEKGWE